MNKKLIILFSVFILIMACSKNSNSFTTDCSTVKSFTADVNPIIQSSCATNAGCHGNGSTHGPGALINYSQVFAARSSIRAAVANGSMPQNSSLSTAQKNNILCWIDAGAINN